MLLLLSVGCGASSSYERSVSWSLTESTVLQDADESEPYRTRRSRARSSRTQYSYNSDAYEPSEEERAAERQRATPIDEGRLNMGIAGYVFPDSEFELLEEHEKWDTAQRFELQLMYHQSRDVQVQPVAGTYFYYDRRRWSDNGAKASFESLGAGLEFGALLHPLTYEPRESIDLAFYPYARFGIGTNGGNYRGVSTAEGTASGDLGVFRVEGGIGADLRLIIQRRMMLSIGGGFMWWDTFDTAVVSVINGSGIVVVRNDDTDFDGKDTFLRVTLEFAY